MTNFKKGDYVVLLSYPSINCKWEECMPLNYCYKLSKDSNNYDFYFEKDANNVSNGWDIPLTHKEINNYQNLKFRIANSLEIEEYSKHNKPCKAIKFSDKWCIKIINQEIADYCTEHGQCPPYNINETSYAHFSSFDFLCTTSGKIEKGYTEITYEQFKQFTTKFKRENLSYLKNLFNKLNIK